jgi:hypothetical protein
VRLVPTPHQYQARAVWFAEKTAIQGMMLQCPLPVRCANFRQQFTLEDAIGSHACSREASRRVTNGIPLGCPPFLPVDTTNSVQTLKADHYAAITADPSFSFTLVRDDRAAPGNLHANLFADGASYSYCIVMELLRATTFTAHLGRRIHVANTNSSVASALVYAREIDCSSFNRLLTF